MSSRAHVVSKRSGFTLVELLVVVTIIGILVALLLPAVQSAREAGRRVQCANNLKQIGLACLSHLEAKGVLPTGGMGFDNYDVATPRIWSNGQPADYNLQDWAWGYQILPYIDQMPLWQNTNDNLVAGTPLSFYFCPTRRRPVALSGGYWATQLTPMAMIDYAGNGGTSNAGSSQGECGLGWGQAGDGNDGVICQRQNAAGNAASMSASDLTDGASNTIMLGEKRLNPNFWTKECQPDDNEGYVGGFQDDSIRWGGYGVMQSNGTVSSGFLFWPPLMDRPAPLDSPGSLVDGHNFWYGSSHAGGAQFVFCDGSVTLIHFSVDPEVFRRACCRNDGLTLNSSAL